MANTLSPYGYFSQENCGSENESIGSMAGAEYNSTMAFSPPVMVPSYTPMPMMHTTTTKNLTYEADISIWNNTAGALVAYGHVKSTVGSSFIPVVVMGTWEQLTSQFVNAIFRKTPFKSPEEPASGVPVY
jgi:predicted Na+-dependent transporter